MSQASIGSGSSNESNENHPQGSELHSKTLGAEPGVDHEAGSPASAGMAGAGTGADADTQPTTESMAASSDILAAASPAGIAGGAAVDGLGQPEPGAHLARTDLPDPVTGAVQAEFPDGPNVAPSPWELNAAQGRAKR